MALKDIQIPKVNVMVGTDSSFAVRGLSTSDIEFLVRAHGESMRELFNDFVNGETKLTDLGPVLKQLISRAPRLVSDVINLAADADAEDALMTPKLPIAIQVNALTSIVGLTLSVEGDMGKALETAIQVLGSVNGGMGEMLKGLTNP